MGEISVSLVLYKTLRKDIDRILSIINEIKLIDKFYLIDNSPEKLVSYEMFKKYDFVEYIFNNKNIGYGAGHNIAIKKSLLKKNKYHLVINPDIYFESKIVLGLMDFMNKNAPNILREKLGRKPDIVLSDLAANTTGHRQTDHLKTVALVESAAEFAMEVLKPGGSFVTKVFQGGAEEKLLATLKKSFKSVKHAKPKSSRAGSPEMYLVAKGFLLNYWKLIIMYNSNKFPFAFTG